ncbi:MAG: hypothetical protein LC109_01865 [Bacteroidia bacterium]|nr:hypothetical protein [Bacteroidia bacterium]MCZ2128990.1 hypothetical protein [Bacteroidia bacterium]MCZ2128991.1 hypothetical protein [Bacteroidia bacterium]
MKKIITFLSSILLLIVVFSNKSCTKDKNDCFDCTDGPRDTLYIEKDFLDYWYAETGSWWIFKRTDTVGVDIYDTMTVKSHRREIDFMPGGLNAFEYIKMICLHSYPRFKGAMFNDILIQGREEGAAIAGNYIPLQGILAFKYPFKNDNESTTYELFTSFKTPFSILENVVKISHKYDSTFSCYLSNEVGFCKFEHSDSSVWELVDCNIIRTQ